MQYDSAAVETAAQESAVLTAGEMAMNLNDYTVKKGEKSIELTVWVIGVRRIRRDMEMQIRNRNVVGGG